MQKTETNSMYMQIDWFHAIIFHATSGALLDLHYILSLPPNKKNII